MRTMFPTRSCLVIIVTKISQQLLVVLREGGGREGLNILPSINTIITNLVFSSCHSLLLSSPYIDKAQIILHSFPPLTDGGMGKKGFTWRERAVKYDATSTAFMFMAKSISPAEQLICHAASPKIHIF